MKIEIKNCWSGVVQYSGEHETIRDAVLAALANDSDLSGSNLSGSNLRGSDLSGSNLSGSNLSGSNLTPIRDDIWAVLCSAPKEAVALRTALAAGQVNGSVYRGDCGFGCLVGTLALARGCTEFEIPGLRPNSDRPAERFFLAIKLGDTPEKSQFAALAVQWVDEWLTNMTAAFGPPQEPVAV